MPVGAFCDAGEAYQAELPDWLACVQRDDLVRQVGKLHRQRATETRVHESCRAVRLQPDTAERGFARELRSQVRRDLHVLQGVAQDELARAEQVPVAGNGKRLLVQLAQG